MPIAITGSTKGIGYAIARGFVVRGDRVLLHYGHDEARASEAATSLGDGVIDVIQADLSTHEGTTQLAEAIARHGPLEGLVLNAGPFALADWDTHEPVEICKLFHSNLFASWTLLQQLMPLLRESHGTITVIGQRQIQALESAPRWTAYNAAKAGLVVLMRTITETEGPHGVRINMVNPGIIDTGHYGEAFLHRSADEIPLRRVGTPDDIAGTVLFLHSAEAAYISGAVIEVAGGA